jgi:hypothetical protein
MELQQRGRAAVLTASSDQTEIIVRKPGPAKPDAPPPKPEPPRMLPRAPFLAMTPLQSSRVLPERVTLSWEAVKDADEYEVAVFVNTDGRSASSPLVYNPKPSPPKLIWKKVVKGTKLPYPANAPALEPGKKYGWYAFPLRSKTPRATVREPDLEWFRILDEKAGPEVRALMKAADQQDDPTLLLLLAARLEALDARDEAQPLFQRLADEFKLTRANEILTGYERIRILKADDE